MKKSLCLFLCCAIAFCICGCQNTQSFQQPVTFYYLSREIAYESSSTAILPLTTEGKDLKDFQETMLLYLQGPESEEPLANPFPAGIRLISYERYENTMYLIFSDELGSLSGLDLTLACCCLALTAMELTGTESVSISADKALLGGERSITLHRDTIMLLDIVQQPKTD